MWPFKPSDWKIMYVDSQSFRVRNRPSYIERASRTIYTVLYSASRDKYRIRCTGYEPNDGFRSTEAYQRCLNKQIELQAKKL